MFTVRSRLVLFFLVVTNLTFSPQGLAQQKKKYDSAQFQKQQTTIGKTSVTKKESKWNEWVNELPSNLSIEVLGWTLCLLIGSAVTLFVAYVKRTWRKRKFKQLFGDKLIDFNIVYPSLTLGPVFDRQGNSLQFPYRKNNSSFKMKEPVPLSDIKAALYIAEAFYKASSKYPTFNSDQSIHTKIDLSFCAVGGLLNNKTEQVLRSAANKFYKINTNGVVRIVRTKDRTDFNNSNQFDLGIIIKITHPNFPRRKQFCVAGLGETGTSAAAWYLSNNWRQLRKEVKSKDFGAIIKADIGIDESASLHDLTLE